MAGSSTKIVEIVQCHVKQCLLNILGDINRLIGQFTQLVTANLIIVLTLILTISVYCPPGYYEIGNRTCEPCPVGTYQPDDGSTKCVKCPHRVSYTEPGAARESLCIDICEHKR